VKFAVGQTVFSQDRSLWMPLLCPVDEIGLLYADFGGFSTFPEMIAQNSGRDGDVKAFKSVDFDLRDRIAAF
jgi:hypothetical protein